MIWKILLTLLVIAGAVVAIRRRNRMNMLGDSRPSAVPAIESISTGKRSALQFAAIGLVALMLIGTRFYLYHQWQDAYQIVSVHVIDTRSGKTVTYEAYKGDVKERSFVTVSGRQVHLAEVERMELGGP